MLGILELDHLAGFHIDQVVVVAMLGRLIARASATEIPALENPVLLQQPDGSVNGGNGDVGIESGGATVEFLDVGMVGSFR